LEGASLTAAGAEFRTLDPAKIVKTAAALCARIGERFPDSGLSRVCHALLDEARCAEETCRRLAAPILWLRLAVAICIVAMLGVAVASLFAVNTGVAPFSSVADFFQGIDAAVNELILLGAAVYFLVGLERRMKGSRALEAIHVLRSIAHIIDMHQLTKDPERVAAPGHDTASSPRRSLSSFELARYLDYCSEMLSIVSKIAALYAQNLRDPLTLAAVDEVEGLTNGLSRKIWQKIGFIDRTSAARPD
jgi:hypothetical protein